MSLRINRLGTQVRISEHLKIWKSFEKNEIENEKNRERSLEMFGHAVVYLR